MKDRERVPPVEDPKRLPAATAALLALIQGLTPGHVWGPARLDLACVTPGPTFQVTGLCDLPGHEPVGRVVEESQ